MKFITKCSIIIFCFISFTNCKTTIKPPDGMVFIKGGNFNMGGNNIQARKDEFPVHTVQVNNFFMDETEVTNAQFKKFVSATNYITTAEKDFKYLNNNGDTILQKAGALVFKKLNKNETANPNTWWQFVEGANWQHPQGPNSTIEGKDNYPVVQISWIDAQAYCKWIGKRLPTEAEWEFAARAGMTDKLYTWGNESVKNDKAKCNIWQGEFPFFNTMQDRYERLAPIKSYTPNNYGLYDMAGNVWEWCSDWYDASFYNYCKQNSIFKNPLNQTPNDYQEKVVRGGSFLCNDSYCSGFRVSARMQSNFETSLEHTGFRCVMDIKN